MYHVSSRGPSPPTTPNAPMESVVAPPHYSWESVPAVQRTDAMEARRVALQVELQTVSTDASASGE